MAGTSSSFPKVSVIIVNYNGSHHLVNCLDSLKATDYPSFDLILVDNSSTDNSLQIVEDGFPDCKVIRFKENMGFSIANNIAAKGADGEYLAFLNNDTKVTPSWLTELVKVIEAEPTIAIAQSSLLKFAGDIDSNGDFITRFGRTYNSKKNGFKDPREILSARGAAMIIRKSTFEELGGFDEDYFVSFEDVEIGWRAWIVGYKVVLVPSSVVYHEGGSTLSTMSSMITFHGLKNQLSLVTTHFETPLAIGSLFIIFTSLFAAFIALLIRVGKGSDKFSVNKRAAVKAVIWYMSHARMIWKKHKRIKRQRKISTQVLVQRGLITRKAHEK